jgi:hypothetical protein
MKKFICTLALILLAATLLAGQSEHPSKAVAPYPNELPGLQLYQQAKWKAIQPYISTQADVKRILGESVSVYEKRLGRYVNGYEDDPDWTIVVSYLGGGGDLPASVEGRVSHLTLYPKRRVSLQDAAFPPAFRRYTARGDYDGQTTVYYDACGLRYSVYETDAKDGSFHAGDLNVIIYGPSEADTQKQKNSAQARPQ